MAKTIISSTISLLSLSKASSSTETDTIVLSPFKTTVTAPPLETVNSFSAN